MDKQTRTLQPEEVLGMPYETAASQRDQLADEFGPEWGAERVFRELVQVLSEEVPWGCVLLEVGAASGAITRELLHWSAHVTAMEVSARMLEELRASNIGDHEHLETMQGIVEDLPREIIYDVAVVTFTPRRGLALVQLVAELAVRVSDRIVMIFDDDQSMDWAYLARSASARGLDVRVRLVSGEDGRRAVVLTAYVVGFEPTMTTEDDWGIDARELCVPYPAPRGAAARLVRYFLSVGDRALLVTTAPEGAARLYGNLRTAAHRLARGEVTVRQHEDAIQLVRLPRSGGAGDSSAE
jgi:hypothetical protein